MEKSGSVHNKKVIYICILASVLLHLTGLYILRDWWLDDLDSEAFRARIIRVPPQFKPRRLSALPRDQRDTPRVQMEYLQSEQRAVEIREEDLQLEVSAPEIESQQAPLVLREIASGAKEEVPILVREKMLSPSALGLADSMGIASMDLLRLVDLARANKDHAAVIRDPASRRDLAGYINFTQLRVYGAGSGRGELDAIARYLRDHTRILARVRDQTYEYFLSERLLKDPIHFLFENGGLTAYRDEVLAMFSQEEKALLELYIGQGGFLFIEGSNRYLREMIDQLRAILGAEARLIPIPTSHSVYHSFYEFGGGFPGEDKSTVVDVGDNPSWYYPLQNRQDLLALQQETTFNSGASQSDQEPVMSPLGLWGIEVDGDLVVVLSDLGLHQNWRVSFNADAGGTEPVTYSLMAGTNIIVYALTRDRGIAPKIPPPTWMQDQKPEVALQEPQQGGRRAVYDYDIESSELLDDLEASLALVQAPIGTEIADDLSVRLDGRYSLELFKRGYQGLLLHNLPAGRHWVELSYKGQIQQLQVDLQGGRVTTLTFALNRFAFIAQLRMQEQEDKVRLQRWSEAFGDLELEEVYLAEDREWLEGEDASPARSP